MATEMKHLDNAHAVAREVYVRKIADADTVLENWRNEAARMVRVSAEAIAALEGHVEQYDAFEQERRAALARTELHQLIEAHHGIVDGARNITKRAMNEHAQAYVQAGIAMQSALVEALASATAQAT